MRSGAPKEGANNSFPGGLTLPYTNRVCWIGVLEGEGIKVGGGGCRRRGRLFGILASRMKPPKMISSNVVGMIFGLI